MSQVYDPKYPGEGVYVTMDFTDRLSVDATVASGTVAIAVAIGIDPGVGTMMSGAEIVVSPYVQRLCTAGVAGCTYEITWTAICSDGEVLVEKRYLPVRDRIA